jgi:hypothetical protein
MQLLRASFKLAKAVQNIKCGLRFELLTGNFVSKCCQVNFFLDLCREPSYI